MSDDEIDHILGLPEPRVSSSIVARGRIAQMKREGNKTTINGECREVDVTRGGERDLSFINAPRHMGVPIGTRVKSGHWWVLVGAQIGTDAPHHFAMNGFIIVNGDKLFYPKGDWFVCEDCRFKALKDSSEPMQWLSGDELWEKVLDQTPHCLIIREQRVGARSDRLGIEAQ